MGILYLVSTPIGNLEDISLRAVKTLFTVDYVLCEDTRKTGLLLQRLREEFSVTTSHKPNFLSYFEVNETKRIPQAIKLLKENKYLALVSSAGTPLISDPGFKLIRECITNEIKIESIPGPSAVVSALVVSGFPTDKFIFLGFLPKESAKRNAVFKNLSSALINTGLRITVIVFESPYRLISLLEDLQQQLGDIKVAICREITKLHEEIRREKVSESIKYFKNNKPRGEFTLVFRIEERE